MDFKDKFKSVRISLGYNQKDFGKILGLSQQAISGIETGSSEPSKTLIVYFEYRYSDKIPLRIENHTPGANNSFPCEGDDSENYKNAMTELFSLIKNPKMAGKFAQNLLCVIKKDPERFYDNFYSRIIGDCDMLKDLKENRRKHLRILK